MNYLDILLVSVSLAMDCFSISIVLGAIVRQWQWSAGIRIAFFFGLFQALMPLIGWAAIRLFATRLETFGRWISFALLLFLGLRMIVQSRHASEEKPVFNPTKLSTQLLLAVATSIDALAIGVSMAVIGYSTVRSLTIPLFSIGIASVILSLIGHELGIRLGSAICRHIRPELVGGIVLVAIGVKVLIA